MIFLGGGQKRVLFRKSGSLLALKRLADTTSWNTEEKCRSIRTAIHEKPPKCRRESKPN